MSGALAGGRKRLDLFGVFVVAVVTAIGGGTLRDLLLGRLPVFWVREPEYLAVVAAATVGTILFTRRRMPRMNRLLAADAVGLALFSVSGAQIAETVTDAKVVVVLMGAGLLTTLLLRLISLRYGFGLPSYELPGDGGGAPNEESEHPARLPSWALRALAGAVAGGDLRNRIVRSEGGSDVEQLG